MPRYNREEDRSEGVSCIPLISSECSNSHLSPWKDPPQVFHQEQVHILGWVRFSWEDSFLYTSNRTYSLYYRRNWCSLFRSIVG